MGSCHSRDTLTTQSSKIAAPNLGVGFVVGCLAMNQSPQVVPYREGGAPHDGLPFPRANMTPLIALTGVASAAGLVLPLVLLGTNPSAIYRTMREGGISMWLLLLVMPVSAILVAVLSALAIRGRKIPPAAIFGFALFALPVAALGTISSQRRMFNALAGEAIEPSQKMRIAFEGTQEALAALQYGQAICAFCVGAAALGCAGIAASVDRARVTQSKSASWIAGALIPFTGILITLALAVATRSLGAAPLALLFSFVSLVLIAVVAALAARAAPALPEWHDRAEANRMLGAILTAAVGSALALWLLDRGAMVAVERLVLGACSGESVDPSQRVRILMEGREEARAFAILSAVHPVMGAAAFLPALISGSGKGKQPFSAHGIGALVLATIGALGFWGTYAYTEGLIGSVASRIHPTVYPVSLPLLADVSSLPSPRGRVIVVTKGGAPRSLTDDDYESVFTFAADKDATAASILAALPGDGGRGTSAYFVADKTVELLVASNRPVVPDPTITDPALRAMMVPEGAAVTIRATKQAAKSGSPGITFLPDGRLLIQNVAHPSAASSTVSISPTLPSDLKAALGNMSDTSEYYLNIDDTTTVGALVTVVDAFREPHSRLGPDVHVRLLRR